MVNQQQCQVSVIHHVYSAIDFIGVRSLKYRSPEFALSSVGKRY